MLPVASVLFGLLATSSVLAQLAPLEQPDGAGIYFGAWYNRILNDTPLAINQRLNYRNLSIWQSDMNITDTLQTAEIDQFLDQVAATKTDAIVYLTLYPFKNYDGVSDKAIEDLIVRVKRVVDNGSRMFIRYASEMNGAWFIYGQQPESFIKSWRRIVGAVRKAVQNPQNLAFIWAPNSGNGYPFAGQLYSATNKSAEFKTMDTNGNNDLDKEDDPYTPYYPGDEWVDWVGFSVYHYGKEWRWEQNVLPRPDQVESILTGRNGFGFYNMYRMFSGDGSGGQPSSKSKGGKPFVMTESGATVHLAFRNGTKIDNTNDTVNIKRNWWRQYLNTTFLTAYPKVKAICTFEFVKDEETTWRDFTNFGTPRNILRQINVTSNVENDAAATLKAFQEDIQGAYGKVLIWANMTSRTQSKASEAMSNSVISFSTVAVMTVSTILVSIYHFYF